jgi:N6-L-threonylcarbamoyladenine synthase
LRKRLAALCTAAGVPLFLAQPQHTGDNAAMIAFCAFADSRGVANDSDYSLAFNPSLAL